jgi:2-desacetyl-2-hydroxyethyl bacteriochlorophyllide A dehydrogenase
LQAERLFNASRIMNLKMRAAILESPRKIEIAEVPRVEPGPDEICVQLEGCGVCASNLPPWQGQPWFNYPFEPGAPGHEGWGRVASAGPKIKDFQIGDRVGLLSQHAYAEFDVAKENAAVKLPDNINDLPFPAEPLGCGVNVFKRARFVRGETIAVIGIGFLGAIIVRLAALQGVTVIAITRATKGLEIARSYGAAYCVQLDDHWRVIEAVKQLTNGRLCDAVVEAVGKQWPLDLAAELTAERGRLIVAGYHQDGPRQVNMQLWNWRGLDVINAHERDPEIYKFGMEAAVDAVASGRLDPSLLYTHWFSLDRIGDAFQAAFDRPDGFMKALVLF